LLLGSHILRVQVYQGENPDHWYKDYSLLSYGLLTTLYNENNQRSDHRI